MINFCKEVIRFAVRSCDLELECVGFVFGGDANIGITAWRAAFLEDNVWRLTFEEPQFLYGVGKKEAN